MELEGTIQTVLPGTMFRVTPSTTKKKSWPTYPGKSLAHFAGYVGQDFMLIVQRHPEHRSGQHRLDRPFQFHRFFICHSNLVSYLFKPLRGKHTGPAGDALWGVHPISADRAKN